MRIWEFWNTFNDKVEVEQKTDAKMRTRFGNLFAIRYDNDDDVDDYKEKYLGSDDDDDDDDEVPHEWMFNSYMAYIMWGPFAKDEKKLSIFLLGKYIVLFDDDMIHKLTQNNPYL